jgi:signal transduction histidine kinase
MPELRLPPEPVWIQGDVRRLDRIVGNVLDNARHHAPDSPVEVRVDTDGATASVAVSDRGPGVAPENLEHLFDRFFKADASRGSGGGSSGLGLAIAAEHAALLDGELAAANRPGGGLEVTLRLPVTRSLPAGDGPDTGEADAPDEPGAAPAPRPPARPPR